MKVHNKLVRDKIAEIIEASGKTPVTHGTFRYFGNDECVYAYQFR